MPNRYAFSCIDGHTCGNPVRLVTSGAPILRGQSMSEKRQHFLQEFDWIRNALMFEPRGHDMMSGAFLYPPTTEDGDIAILFIETSGCLPMCGHGTIGAITLGLEHGLIQPRQPGRIRLDAPAGRIEVEYSQTGEYVDEVRLTNVPSYLAHEAATVDCPGLGEIVFDVAYGGNFYAIIEPQKNFDGLDAFNAADILHFSPIVRELARDVVECIHPEDATINGVSHVMWTGPAHAETAHARNAVFYGNKAIDRSPCGTGTSARMAQLAARGDLKAGDTFVHESYIGSCFQGRHEGDTAIGNLPAIRPSIAGWARITGLNTIFVDQRDPFRHGFQVI